ncbi:hypothetical protein OE88DRAFT_1646687 [Heliocybe sulcata]|uniref:RRM domain-containing protein n=1 Tax=Heliocybe sulcata TaxID=5364 RepID=A0A5C3MZB0_9AGAM|nr:hypothetical protein OE88DRAFT_1646687 [Heliocybe sulcata]
MAAGFNRSRKPYTRPEARARAPEGSWMHDKAPPNVVSRPSNSRSTVEGGQVKLLVSNLHYEITPKDLIAIFGRIGTLVREPIIKYDRSGRSTGVAIIHYETAEEAARAKKQFEGVLAKGQEMTIVYDTAPTFGPRRDRRASAPSSLINRIQKPGLLDRLSQDDIRSRPAPASFVFLPCHLAVHTHHVARADRKSGPGPIRSRGRGGGRPGPRKPKTAEDLDKELDFFMTDGTKGSTGPVQKAAEGDVEMT